MLVTLQEVEHVRPNWGGRHAFIAYEIKDGSDPVAVQKWQVFGR